MQRLRMTAGASIVSVLLGLVATSCQDPTEIVIEVRTNVPYRAGIVTAFTVGAPGTTELADSSTETRDPWGADGFVGSLVLVPDTEKTASVSAKVVMGIRRDPRECVPPTYAGCVVARRSLSYLPHQRLLLPVVLYANCENVACDPSTTCSALGQCVPASVDPSSCSAADGCVLPGDPKPGFDAGNDGAPADGANDAEAGSCPTGPAVLTDDPLNCGACGKACNAFETCNGAGRCECLKGLLACDGRCVESNDARNCGACGHACTEFYACASTGQCAGGCAPGDQICPAQTGHINCVDFNSDPFHCGGCGVECRAAEVCVAGKCRRYAPSLTCTLNCDSTCCAATIFPNARAACCAPFGSQSTRVVCVADIDATQCPR